MKEKITALEQIIKSDYKNTAGIVVKKDNKILYENYFNNLNSNSTLQIFSVTKSIVCLLLGIAIDKGYIKSVDEKILSFFPDYKVKENEKTIQKITLKHLMTMTAPYKFETEPYIEYFTNGDYVKTGLDYLGGDGTIGDFRYTPLIGPDILTAILMKVTGKSVLDFAKENLFNPLMITVKDNIIFHSQEEQFAMYNATDISGWVADRNGVNTGAWGLTLTTRDMAKIGQLLLDGGKVNNSNFNNKQIVSKEWIDELTTVHSRWNDLLYGYLWWIIDDKEGVFAALGDGGNTIYVNKKKNMVVAINATFIQNAPDRLALIKRYIEPIFD